MSQEQKYRAMRQKLLVDPKVQGQLMLRAVGYWGLMMLAMILFLFCWQVVSGPPRLFVAHFKVLWEQYSPSLLGSALMLPLVLFDMLRLSNRFAGPVLRLRRSMRQLANGEVVHPVRFRDGDYWQDFADDFNSVSAHLQKLKTAAARAEVEDDEERLALTS